jgi:cell division septum initiation protein DivIVA
MTAEVPGGDPRTADVYTVLDDLTDLVEAARAMPMSDRCVVNRNEVLDLLDAIRQMLPTAVKEAEEILADRVGVVEEGYREAERVLAEANERSHQVIEQATATQAHILSTHEITTAAVNQAEEIGRQASTDAEQMRREVDQYVEDKFAAFEEMLSRTLNSVQKGRDRIRERY